ncbi:succinate dehydrogenase, hydrophobic membrane anchor protein [Denitratisoma sp. DHT3]|uniref:succinate dehydrogenase, hydrophobic membrane anchor protein n=1 Tax=Denitratisoma sp. DHT3 TaxID=1981880 RepID=UPI0016454AE3|nr:succinate dehydrogenase, hydrophobic membrane anchor protein [Denitratisoma sp. DHT3]
MKLFGGLRPWVIQRLTALYLLLSMLTLTAFIVFEEPMSFTAWRALMLQPTGKVAILMFFTALFLHAWVGLRDVLLDYAKPLALRSLLMASGAFGLIALELWVIVILTGTG